MTPPSLRSAGHRTADLAQIGDLTQTSIISTKP
ncbi:MAG: hypothetical protein JWQ64_453 [Subtercola sp.]|nr:hypothetical protein [Subtercola sp.]